MQAFLKKKTEITIAAFNIYVMYIMVIDFSLCNAVE